MLIGFDQIQGFLYGFFLEAVDSEVGFPAIPINAGSLYVMDNQAFCFECCNHLRDAIASNLIE